MLHDDTTGGGKSHAGRSGSGGSLNGLLNGVSIGHFASESCQFHSHGLPSDLVPGAGRISYGIAGPECEIAVTLMTYRVVSSWNCPPSGKLAGKA